MPSILPWRNICMKQVCRLCGLCTLLLAIWSPRLVEAQFIPPELSNDIPSRLIFRAQGLVEAWKDPSARRAVLRGRIVLDPSEWREQFAGTGGVAVVGPDAQGLDNFTITGESDLCSAQDCVSAVDSSQFDDSVPPELSFSSMESVMMITEGGFLRFDNLILSDIAGTASYEYSPSQPYRSVGIGSGTWPTLAMAPGSRLVLINITMVYRNPSPEDTCEQYNQRAIYSLQQVYGANNVTVFNRTAARFPNGIIVPVKVFNGSDNSPLGEARIYVKNVTMSCIAPADPAASGTLSTGQLAAAILAPVVGALLLGLAACLCFRRHRRRKAANVAVDEKDVEAGRVAVVKGPDAGKHSRGQVVGDDVHDKVLPLGIYTGGSGQTSSQHSSAQYQTASYTTGSYPGSSASAPTSSASTAPPTPAVGVGPAGLQSPPTTDGEYGRGQLLSPPALAAMQNPGGASFNSAKAAAAAAAAAQQGSGGYAAPDAAHGQVVFENPSAQQHPELLQQMNSLGAPESPALAGAASVATTWPRSSGEPIIEQHSSGGRNNSSQNASGGAGSGAGNSGSGGNSGGRTNTSAALMSGSPSTAGNSSGRDSRNMLYERGSNMSGLLKARSDMAVLRDLKIGPLLGRGSYGRVYKGRWKAATVAVKIIEHHEGSPGTASSGGKKVNVGRESLLATTMAHPNVVQTYHISTMTVSQRNALANSWLEEQEREAGVPAGTMRRNSRSKTDATLGETEEMSDSSSEEAQKDPVETWMLMEFCEKGSLERAIGRCKFVRKDNGKPEMIGIYKALLDTASGLDYLHSIGVVHGDLKTANVLLKGSTRDVRGFACKITDFGLSRVLDLDATHISTRTYGTIVYMPAELLLTGRMTQATDIYSFGLMMWELYTSTRVFEEGLSIGQIFYMIAYQGWRPGIPPGCPQGFAALMQACWHQNPEQRPTVQQLLRSLQSLYMAEKKAMAAAKDLATKGQAKQTVARTNTADAASERDRTSMESDKSDRYKNAAAASREDLPNTASYQRGTAESAAISSMAAAIPSSAAAANAQQWQLLQQPQGSLQGGAVPTKEALAAAALAGGLGPPQAGSIGEGQGSGGSLATIDYYVQDESGGPKPGHGSGDTIVTLDENVYQPWAEAVIHDQQPEDLDGPRSPGRNRRRSLAPGDFAPQRQQLQPQPQLVQSAAVAAGGVAGNPPPPHNRQVTQQGGGQAPAKYYNLQIKDSEIQPADDNEGMPSESLFRQDNTSSSSAVYVDVQDLDNGIGPAGCAAENPRRTSLDQQLLMQQQQLKAPPPAQRGPGNAAQGFVEAIEMVSRSAAPGAASAVAPAPMAAYPAGLPSNNSNRQIPYHYQQRPLMLQPGHNSSGVQAALPSSLPQGLGSNWSSISTGTLPPVVGDSPCGSYTNSLPGSFTGPSSLPGTNSARWARSSSGRGRDGSFSTNATVGGSRGPSPSGSTATASSAGLAAQAAYVASMASQSSPSGGRNGRPGSQTGWSAAQGGLPEDAAWAGGPVVSSPSRGAAAGNAGSSRPMQGSPFARAATDDAPAGAQGGGQGPAADPAAAPVPPSPFAALAHRGESLFAPL